MSFHKLPAVIRFLVTLGIAVSGGLLFTLLHTPIPWLAHEVNANLFVVSGYQLFRILFIFLVVSPLLKMILSRMLGRTPNRQPGLSSADRFGT